MCRLRFKKRLPRWMRLWVHLPRVRRLMVLDVYLVLRHTWDVYRSIENHDLAAACKS